MSVFEALVLGIVQGLTEFLPISSSGHLVVVPALLGWDDVPVPFDVLLHAATLLALLVYFFRDFVEALDGLGRPSPGRRFAWLLVLGTIPAGVLGYLFERPLERAFSDEVAVAIQIIITGVILAATESYARWRKRDERIEATELSVVEKIALEVKPPTAVAVGLAQAVSIIPGISRSGATIGTGLLFGLSRPQSARFSFMLSVPILLGASLAKIPELGKFDVPIEATIVGFLAALVSGYLAIAGMIGYLQRRGLYPFAAYCLVVGIGSALVLSSN